MFSIERPSVLYAILLLIPALIYVRVSYAHLSKSLQQNGSAKKMNELLPRIRFKLFIQTLFRALAWVMAVLACAGISWGMKYVPTQRSGHGVSFVFDISYSMTAPDAIGGLTRLEAERRYASELLEYMDGVPVSVVIAKGDGIVAVPLTEDRAAVTSLLSSLSPALMTSEGTSLGLGIDAAVSSFPLQSALACDIWLFTDGEETDGSLTRFISYDILIQPKQWVITKE